MSRPPAMLASGMSRAWSSLLLAAAALAAGEERAAAQTGSVSTAHVVSLATAKSGALAVSVTSGMVQTIGNLTDNALNNFPAAATRGPAISPLPAHVRTGCRLPHSRAPASPSRWQ